MKWASGMRICWFSISWLQPCLKTSRLQEAYGFRKGIWRGHGFVQWFNLQKLTCTSHFSGGAEASSNDVLQNAEWCCLASIFVRPQIVQRKNDLLMPEKCCVRQPFCIMDLCNSAHKTVERYKTAWRQLETGCAFLHFIYTFHHPAVFFLSPLSCVSHLKLLLFSLLTALLSWKKKRSRITE